jgi:LysM repeat protein
MSNERMSSETENLDTITIDEIIEVIQTQFVIQLPGDDGVGAHTILEELGLSEANLYDLLTTIEEVTGVDFQETDPADVETIGDLVAYVNGSVMKGEAAGYVVEPGDSLAEIARRHGTTLEAILESNEITHPNSIQAGARLVLPGGAPVRRGRSGPVPHRPVARPPIRPEERTTVQRPRPPITITSRDKESDESEPNRPQARPPGSTKTRPTTLPSAKPLASTKGKPASQGKPAPTPAPPQSRPLGIEFSVNSRLNRIEGWDFPTDMPPVRWPQVTSSCSASVQQIREAWALAHYYTWRAHQVMECVRRFSDRRIPWNDGYESQIKNAKGQFINYAPRAWFGPYDDKRYDRIRRSIAEVWNGRFLGRTFTIKCRDKDNGGAHPCYQKNPQTNRLPGANHIVLGTINLCAGWFNKEPEVRAKTIVHEMFHWLRVPGTGWWVTDIHDYWTKSCRARHYRAARALYGDKAAFIANNKGCRDFNYNRTWRNCDNYALFIYKLGQAVYTQKTVTGATVTKFPVGR